MDYFPDEQKKSKKPLIVGGLIALGVIIIGVAAFAFWKYFGSPLNTAVRTPIANQNTNVQNSGASGDSSKSVGNSTERALTTEEKVKYYFNPKGDIWMRVTNYTDGTPPKTVFFLGSNKSK